MSQIAAEVVLTREELYERVWSTPMQKLAAEFGMSDVGLAKICKKHKIPKPSRGFWARLQVGQILKRIPLPAHDGSCKIIFRPPLVAELKESGLAQELDEMIHGETLAEAKITVASSLRGAHNLVILARDEFEQAKQGKSGILEISGTTPLALFVSRAQVRRALLICDALLKAFEARGYRVSAGPKVTIFDESVSFGIKEALATQRVQPDEHDLSGRYEFGHSRFLNRTVATGKLTLFVDDTDHHWASGCRKLWRDGNKQTLEIVLNRVVAGLIEVAARKREHAIEMEQRRQAEAEAAKERQEAAKRRTELIAKQTAERNRLDVLLKQAEALRQSQAIRELVDAVKMGNHSAGGRLDDWMAWALMHADRLDPTKESPRCVLDEEVPEEPRRW